MEKTPGQADEEEGFWSCNIDGRGRLLRLVIAAVFLGLAAWLWWGLQSAFWSAGLLAFGLVSLYEGLRGWCVLRAFGMRTPF